MTTTYLKAKLTRKMIDAGSAAWDEVFGYWDAVADTEYAVKMANEAAARAGFEYAKAHAGEYYCGHVNLLGECDQPARVQPRLF